MRRLLRLLLKTFAAIVAGAIIVGLGSEIAVSLVAWGRSYDSVERVPSRKAAVVLGTSKFVAAGRENLHYRYRIDAAAELFHAGRVEYIIVSGNGAEPHYNEPKMMRADLVARGVPTERIYADPAGLRTLDSVIRADDVFDAGDCIVVSQPAHVARAIFIGRMRGQDVIGFQARNVGFRTDPKTAVRERLARILAVFDVTLGGQQPKFTGGKVELGITPALSDNEPS